MCLCNYDVNIHIYVYNVSYVIYHRSYIRMWVHIHICDLHASSSLAHLQPLLQLLTGRAR